MTGSGLASPPSLYFLKVCRWGQIRWNAGVECVGAAVFLSGHHPEGAGG